MIDWEVGTDMHKTAVFKTDNQQQRTYSTGDSTQGSGDRDGEEIQESRGDICIRITDSLCCKAETNIMKQLHSNKN